MRHLGFAHGSNQRHAAIVLFMLIMSTIATVNLSDRRRTRPLKRLSFGLLGLAETAAAQVLGPSHKSGSALLGRHFAIKLFFSSHHPACETRFNESVESRVASHSSKLVDHIYCRRQAINRLSKSGRIECQQATIQGVNNEKFYVASRDRLHRLSGRHRPMGRSDIGRACFFQGAPDRCAAGAPGANRRHWNGRSYLRSGNTGCDVEPPGRQRWPISTDRRRKARTVRR